MTANAPHTTRSQRWRERRAAFVDGHEVIDPRKYAVDVIPCAALAKPFVLAHHYSGSFPATRLSCGLFRTARAARSQLVGVCSFSIPVNYASVLLQTGLAEPKAAIDLGRLVLLDDVPANGESWFVSRAMQFLRNEKPEVEAVIAYSDPVARQSSTGEFGLPGHIGMVYQALSAQFRGRSTARWDYLMPNGQLFSARALSKLLAGDTGAVYAGRQLIDAGADKRQPGEPPKEWIARLEGGGFLARRRHPGNLVYTFALTKNAKLAARTRQTLPYPKPDGAKSP